MITLKTIDAHAEADRCGSSSTGFPSPRGRTMIEKREWVQAARRRLRRLLMLEPRGHAGHVRRRAHRAGDARLARRRDLHERRGYATMSGHGIIAVTTIALERGLLMPGGDGSASSSTRPPGPCGPRRWARRSASAASAFVNVPSFVLQGGLPVRAVGPPDSRRRRLRRRVLRHRRQRGGRPVG